MTAGVKVFRAPDIWMDRNRVYKVVIDDVIVDELWPSQNKLFNVEPGQHRIQVKIDFMRSNELLLPLEDGQQAELACRGRGSMLALVNTLFRRRSYLDLHPVTADEIKQIRGAIPTLPPPRNLGAD